MVSENSSTSCNYEKVSHSLLVGYNPLSPKKSTQSAQSATHGSVNSFRWVYQPPGIRFCEMCSLSKGQIAVDKSVVPYRQCSAGRTRALARRTSRNFSGLPPRNPHCVGNLGWSARLG